MFLYPYPLTLSLLLLCSKARAANLPPIPSGTSGVLEYTSRLYGAILIPHLDAKNLAPDLTMRNGKEESGCFLV